MERGCQQKDSLADGGGARLRALSCCPAAATSSPHCLALARAEEPQTPRCPLSPAGFEGFDLPPQPCQSHRAETTRLSAHILRHWPPPGRRVTIPNSIALSPPSSTELSMGGYGFSKA